MAKQTYRVKRPLEHGEGKEPAQRYEAGEEIALEDAHAKRLLKSGAIEELPPTKVAKSGKAGEGKIEA